MKKLTTQELTDFLRSLDDAYDMRVPLALSDGTRALGRLKEGKLALSGGPIPRKPTEVFFPQFDRVFAASPAGLEVAQLPAHPLFVVGFTAEDLDCLEFVDKFFSTNYRDQVYFSKREGSVAVGLAGRCGRGGAFMRIAGGKCDLEWIADGEGWLIAAYTEAGRALEARMECAVTDAAWHGLRRDSQALPTDDRGMIERASGIILDGDVPDDFWAEIADRCIACTGCNLACPTCTCFGVQDRQYDDRVERHRVWDSCQLDGFMREASGHNPMGTEALRTRRRIHHKLAADRQRWGHITCFLCGRCDEVCPTGIGIKSVCREIVKRYG